MATQSCSSFVGDQREHSCRVGALAILVGDKKSVASHRHLAKHQAHHRDDLHVEVVGSGVVSEQGPERQETNEHPNETSASALRPAEPA